MSENELNNAEVKEVVDATSGSGGQSMPGGVDPMAQMMAIGKKQLFWQRVMAVVTAGIFLVIAICAYILIPKITTTIGNIDNAVADAQNSIKNIDVMVDSVTEASDNLNKMVDENADNLNDAMAKLSSVDFDGLNKAITDLQDAVGPMASFFNKFR